VARKIFWMAHPLSGCEKYTQFDNLALARWWLKYLLLNFPKIDFAADWILWAEALDDTNTLHRKRGLAFDTAMIRRLDGIVLVGHKISRGMQIELKAARAAGKIVVDLTPYAGRPVREKLAKLFAAKRGLNA
jgi:hypothetical protein